ncbi:MAG: hypothetical protein ACK4FJ_09610 [Ferrovibrio sp.]|uniref:hypothetical protein n=1 Tax=Ferrovibrio sp. TaxID=1917215 RepID=UPI00391AEB30
MDRQDILDTETMMSPVLPEPGVLPWRQADGEATPPALPLQDADAGQAMQAGLAAAIAQCEAALGSLDDITRLIAKIRGQIAVLGERGLAAPEQDILRNNIGLLVGRIEASIARANSDGRNLLRDDGFDPALGIAGTSLAEEGAAVEKGPPASRSLADAAQGLLAEQGGMVNWLSMSPPNTFVAGYLLDGFAHRVETRLVALAVQKQALEDRHAFVTATLRAAGETPSPGLAPGLVIAGPSVTRAAACLS